MHRVAMNKADEHDLVRKAKAGDAKAMEGLIRAHQQGLYAFILRMCGRPEVAEDIVQEAFVRVLSNLNRFDTRFRFSTWLFTIAKRLFVNSVQKHQPSYDTEAMGLVQGPDTNPAGLVARTEVAGNARQALETALIGLQPQQREIILLYHQFNWAIARIADHLNMPEGTVKSHLHRARKRMRRRIESDRRSLEHVQEIWA